jgi:hypothetical protein
MKSNVVTSVWCLHRLFDCRECSFQRVVVGNPHYIVPLVIDDSNDRIVPGRLAKTVEHFLIVATRVVVDAQRNKVIVYQFDYLVV